VARPTSALAAATDLDAVLVYSVTRGRRQQRTFLIAGGAMGALALAGAVGMFWNVGLWFFTLFFAVVAAIVFGVMVLMRGQIGSRMLGVGARGIFVPHVATPVAWEEVAAISVERSDNRIRGRRVSGNLASAGLARGGINDGGREVSVVLRDPDGLAARIGSDADYLRPLHAVGDGARGFWVLLSNAVDEAEFLAFAEQLRTAADARGIPFLVSIR
jgi:hypothetical protein